MQLRGVQFVGSVAQFTEQFGDLRVANRLSAFIFEKILLGHVGDVGGFRIFGEQVVIGLIFTRPIVGRNRLPPILGIGKLRIDIENNTTKRMYPMANDLPQFEFCSIIAHGIVNGSSSSPFQGPHGGKDGRHGEMIPVSPAISSYRQQTDTDAVRNKSIGFPAPDGESIA